jgi:hypothetical protein
VPVEPPARIATTINGRALQTLGQLQVAGSSGDSLMDFLPMDRHVQRRDKAQPHAAAFHAQDGDRHTVSNHNRFPTFAAENQHRSSLLGMNVSLLTVRILILGWNRKVGVLLRVASGLS